MRITFQKSGKDIKAAISSRREQLNARLAARNSALDAFLNDTVKVRSYIVRRTAPNYGHHGQGYVLYGENDISSEEREEIDQLCQRIFEIEQELHRLSFTLTHLDDQQLFELSFEELVGYGFSS